MDSLRQIGHHIGGKAVAGQSGRRGHVYNPSTGEVSAELALANREEVEAAISAAAAALPAWAETTPPRARPHPVPVQGASGGARR